MPQPSAYSQSSQRVFGLASPGSVAIATAGCALRFGSPLGNRPARLLDGVHVMLAAFEVRESMPVGAVAWHIEGVAVTGRIEAGIGCVRQHDYTLYTARDTASA